MEYWSWWLLLCGLFNVELISMVLFGLFSVELIINVGCGLPLLHVELSTK